MRLNIGGMKIRCGYFLEIAGAIAMANKDQRTDSLTDYLQQVS